MSAAAASTTSRSDSVAKALKLLGATGAHTETARCGKEEPKAR